MEIRFPERPVSRGRLMAKTLKAVPKVRKQLTSNRPPHAPIKLRCQSLLSKFTLYLQNTDALNKRLGVI
jgi:hypothetical protein